MRKNGTNVDLTDNVEGLTVDRQFLPFVPSSSPPQATDDFFLLFPPVVLAEWKKFERDHVREINMHETAGGFVSLSLSLSLPVDTRR